MKYRKITYIFIMAILLLIFIYQNIDTSKIEIVQSTTIPESVDIIKAEPIAQGNIITIGKENIININTATKGELETLYRVGEKTADKIIKYRETNGGFKKKEEIMKVKGIGEKMYEKMKDNIVVK